MPATEPCGYYGGRQGDVRTVPDGSPGCCPLCGEPMRPFSPELIAKAGAALDRLAARRDEPEDIEAWAERLAADVVRADAEEKRAGLGTERVDAMTTDKPETMVVIIHETALQSWLRDAGSIAALLVSLGIGIAAGSPALQWTGAALWLLWLFARAAADSKNRRRLTPQEAADMLRERFGVEADASKNTELRDC